MLVACIVHHQRDRRLQSQRRDLPQQVANCFSRDVRVVRHPNQFMAERVQRTQHVVSLPTGRATHKQACLAPEPTQKRRHHEMGRIHKKQRPLPSPRFCQARLKLLILKKTPVSWRVPPPSTSAAPARRPPCATTTSTFRARIFALALVCDTRRSVPRSAGMLRTPYAAAVLETRLPTIPDAAS